MQIMPRLTQLNRREVLLYLGHRGQEIGPELARQLDESEAALLAAARPRLVWRAVPVEADCHLGGTELTLEGADIRALLRPCREAVLMAATLGPDVDALIQRAQVRDMAQAVILDACASTAIENVCNHAQADLEAYYRQRGKYLTDRFSPGYGDLPLEQQPEFCRVLDTARKIGLAVGASLMLTPCKSVTAVMGVADTPQPRRAAGCENCNLFYTCQFRKKGNVCHE